MRHLATFLIALTFPSVASAANWVFVANCGEQDQPRAYSYDGDSLRRDGSNVIVRIKGDYSQIVGSRVTEVSILWSFDCANRAIVERSRAVAPA